MNKLLPFIAGLIVLLVLSPLTQAAETRRVSINEVGWAVTKASPYNE